MKQGNRKKSREFGIAREFAFIVVAALLLFGLTVGLASECVFGKTLFTNVESSIEDVDLIAVGCVSSSRFDEYLESEGMSAASQEALSRLQSVCDKTEFNYLYLIKPDFSNNTVTNSLSVWNTENSNLESYSVGQITDMTGDDFRDACWKIMNGESDFEIVYRFIASNDHATGLTPLKDSDGNVIGIMCAESPLEWYRSLFFIYQFLLVGVAVLFFLICGFFSRRFTLRRITRPLERVTAEAKRFASSQTVRNQSLDDLTDHQNEIGTLARSINSMEHQIVDSLESIRLMTAEQKRIEAEMDIAAKIQQAALPHEFPAFPERAEFDLYATMDPAKEVGGDFYDFFLIDDDHLALVIADVSGKGIPAALFMMVSKIMIENHATLLTDPKDIISSVNNKLSSDNEISMFVTAWLGILELSTGVLTCCNAGHEYPAIRQAGNNFALLHDKHGTALGLMGDMPYDHYVVPLQPGDTIFVYTDGIPEANDIEQHFYGTERLITTLNACSDTSAQGLVNYLTDDVAAFTKGAEQFDDLTALALTYLGPIE